jgi:hypothetical protein
MTLLLDWYPPQHTNVNHMVVKEAGAEALHQLLNLFGAGGSFSYELTRRFNCSTRRFLDEHEH